MSKRESYNLAEIGSRLKLIRTSQRKTQARMAQELGISLSHYSKLEVGIGGMSHGLIIAICHQFGVPEAWLVRGEGETPDLSAEITNVSAQETIAAINCRRELSVLSQRLLQEEDEMLEKVVTLLMDDNLKETASKVADTMKIPMVRALTMLVREKLR